MLGKEENEAQEGERLITAEVILNLSLLNPQMKTHHAQQICVGDFLARKEKEA